MKAVFERIPSPESESILVRRFSLPQFDAPYHFHPEYELTWIIKGQGQRYVGWNVESFESGDLVWLGPNVPHCWINTACEPGEEVEALVVQFDASIWEGKFRQIPEMKWIQTLLQRPPTGSVIPTEIRPILQEKLLELVNVSSLDRLTQWMFILEILGQCSDLRPLDRTWDSPTTSPQDSLRFHRVYQLIIQKFQENITLAEAASVAGLSITSFCRFFKCMTQKTFIEVVLEFRIQQACLLLRTTKKSIQEITFESGFQDISYFNKVFKKRKGMSPSAYRRTH